MLCVVCVFGAAVHGTLGIGFPMIATPLLAMVTDVRTAVLILVLPTVTLNLVNVVQGGGWGKSIAKYWPLAVYGVIGSYLGTRLLILVPPETFRPLLAGAILLYLNAEHLGVGFSWVNSHPRIGMIVFGMGAGLLGGMVNVMLPALVIFALEMELEKVVTIQVFNLCFLFGKLTQGLVFFQAGFFTVEVLKISLLLVILSVIVSPLAMSFRHRINEALYKRWLRYLLVGMSVILVGQYVLS
ncbi:sulfite exporter TauE/SafE family protein [Desulfopila sp. IMCC35008]|uniref:sulfite exporter TauE/SafE family protein n=1 Tax=Desulfopila sp. IMCC35008 TaxID=2653858 RepID=UPI0013D39128|nr:sulfite exporter TauE/SafE family protein [Desulfopila sp. IMCC35008]